MSTNKRAGRRVGLIVGAVLILGGFGYLAYGGLGESLVYFVTPAELMARRDDAYDNPQRLGRQVEPGSVVWDAEALDLRFTLSDGDHAIEVHSSGAPPQMFRDGIGVLVEGRYSRDGVFRSDNVMVKHSNEYRPPAEGHAPEQLYETLIREDGP
mgnify:CR=1 FL=1